MKSTPITICRTVLMLSVLALAACSTPQGRIDKNLTLFNSLPAETQAKIREGKVEVGYSGAMVLLALGEPDRRSTRTTQKGSSEVWAYRDHGPSVSLGFGIGGGSSGVGGGVGLSTRGERDDDKIRVVLEADKVVSVETAAK